MIGWGLLCLILGRYPEWDAPKMSWDRATMLFWWWEKWTLQHSTVPTGCCPVLLTYLDFYVDLNSLSTYSSSGLFRLRLDCTVRSVRIARGQMTMTMRRVGMGKPTQNASSYSLFLSLSLSIAFSNPSVCVLMRIIKCKSNCINRKQKRERKTEMNENQFWTLSKSN